MNQDKRKRLVKLIHIGKSKLEMDDATYRVILSDIGNVSSSTKMSISELERVLEHMKKCGFELVPNKAGKLKRESDPQSKKIRALWLELHHMGVVKNPSEYSLSQYVQRITGVEHLAWLDSDQSSLVIETLKKWIKRIERSKYERSAK